jgi:hypothetical protein
MSSTASRRVTHSMYIPSSPTFVPTEMSASSVRPLEPTDSFARTPW